MKTTLILDDAVASRLKEEALRQGKTMSQVVEAALRLLLERRNEPVKLPDLPSFSSRGALVDVSDREALYGAMEGR